MFLRVTLLSPSGNIKTRFQFVYGCAHAADTVGRLASYAVNHGNGFSITYSRQDLNRTADELARVNHIMDEVMA